MLDIDEIVRQELDKIKWKNIPDEFVVFDTETTGLDPKKDRIVEIGAVLFQKADYIVTGDVQTFQCFIKQSILISDEAYAKNKITSEMLKDGDTEYDALDKFFEFVGPRDLYAYNGEFDKKFINQTSIRCGYSKSPILEEVFDILKFVRENWTIKPNYRLATVAKHFKLDTTGSHRAVQDCVMALGSFIRLHQNITAIENIERIKKEVSEKQSNPSTRIERINEFNKNEQEHSASISGIDRLILTRQKDISPLDKKDNVENLILLIIGFFLLMFIYFLIKIGIK